MTNHLEDLVKKYLKEGRVMQVATSSDGHPWVCSVYFVSDEELSLYWLSWPTRRHSQEIEQNNKIAATVPIKLDKPVIGIQAAGVAEIIKEKMVVEKIMQKYVNKFDSGKDFYELFKAGKNQHQLFKFTPDKYFLFDEVNFSDGQKHEWTPIL
jgi:uncharacterized protein YhbP (UPF0306 family)